MGWVLMVVGTGFALIPNMLNPMVGFNGSVLLGVGLLFLAGYKLGGMK